MGICRAMFVGQGASDLPEDRYVNTFHFDTGGIETLQDEANALHPLLTNFYTATYNGTHVGQCMSQYVKRAATIRYYSLEDPEPRVPDVRTLTLGASAGTHDLPEECAVVLSLKGSAPVTPRKRGRLFIGPLSQLAITDATATAPARVAPLLSGCLAAAAEALRTGVLAIAGDYQWVIRSAGARVARASTSDPLGALLPVVITPIVGGWIDNAFDTQRRRGAIATSRQAWGPA